MKLLDLHTGMERHCFFDQIRKVIHMPREEIERRFSNDFHQYLQRNFNNPYLFQKFCRHIFDMTQAHGKKVLDVGCGFGLISSYLGFFGSQRVVGVDFDVDRITVFRKLLGMLHVLNVEAKLADFLDFKNLGHFDVVICNEVMSHIRDDWLCLRRIYRCLRPGGVLYISDDNNSLNFYHRKKQARKLLKMGVQPFLFDPVSGQFAERQINPLALMKRLGSVGFKGKLVKPFVEPQGAINLLYFFKKVAGETIRLCHPILIVASPRFEILAVKSRK